MLGCFVLTSLFSKAYKMIIETANVFATFLFWVDILSRHIFLPQLPLFTMTGTYFDSAAHLPDYYSLIFELAHLFKYLIYIHSELTPKQFHILYLPYLSVYNTPRCIRRPRKFQGRHRNYFTCTF